MSNLIIKLGDDVDSNDYETTANIIEGITTILENDEVCNVVVDWIEDTIIINMESGKQFIATAKPSGMKFKFGKTEF